MVRPASSFLLGFVFLIPNGSPIGPFPATAFLNQNSNERCAIHGRLWKKSRGGTSQGTVSSQPVTEGSVFVTDTDLTKLHGEATILEASGLEAGFFEVKELPASQDLLVFYFDVTVPGFMQVEEIRLAPNENKELAPNGPNAPITRLMTATDLLGSVKELVKNDLELAHQAADNESAKSLKAHLDKLNLPAEQEELWESEVESGGGLSGKALGFIGAAAGGAGLAVAAAAGGSETQPKLTSTTTTTTTVPLTNWNCELMAMPVDRRWFNMQRGVVEGTQLKLRAWGTVTIDADGTVATPDGSGQGVADSSAVLPGAPLHSLICAWDADGTTKFFVGTGVTVDVSMSGILHCTINEQPDRDSSYMDNSGLWTFEFCFSMPWGGVQ